MIHSHLLSQFNDNIFKFNRNQTSQRWIQVESGIEGAAPKETKRIFLSCIVWKQEEMKNDLSLIRGIIVNVLFFSGRIKPFQWKNQDPFFFLWNIKLVGDMISFLSIIFIDTKNQHLNLEGAQSSYISDTYHQNNIIHKLSCH